MPAQYRTLRRTPVAAYARSVPGYLSDAENCAPGSSIAELSTGLAIAQLYASSTGHCTARHARTRHRIGLYVSTGHAR
eukprot:713948-Rhodomonas_salina.1